MPVKRTSNYQLSQWESSDKVLMEDFNTDNLNVENALAGLEASKAKQTDLTALKTEVGTKASQSDLTALKAEVGTKANQSELASLRTEVAAKAAQAELNSVSAALNAARASIPKIAVGSYTGDGQPSKTIPLDFTPKAVLVATQYGQMYASPGTTSSYNYGGLALTKTPVLSTTEYNGQRPVVVEITTNGFIVHYGIVSGSNYNNCNAMSNASNTVFNYIAFG